LVLVSDWEFCATKFDVENNNALIKMRIKILVLAIVFRLF